MARKPAARVILNRSRLTDVGVALADGLSEVGRTYIEATDPPDAQPYGEGLVTSGGYLVYADGKKVDGWAQDGRQPKPPRAAKVSKGKGAVLLAGWGFPARFQEHGTARHGAQPFATPALNRLLPHIAEIMEPIVRPALAKL